MTAKQFARTIKNVPTSIDVHEELKKIAEKSQITIGQAASQVIEFGINAARAIRAEKENTDNECEETRPA